VSPLVARALADERVEEDDVGRQQTQHTTAEDTMSMGNRKQQNQVHDDLESIREGFVELGMPEHRRAEAYQIVSEVLAANQVVDFRWYKRGLLSNGHRAR